MRNVVVPVGILWLASLGCATATRPPFTPPSSPAPNAPAPAAGTSPPAAAPGVEAPARPDTSPLRFDYDAHILDPDAQARLRNIADYLRLAPRAKVRITGHADERGTDEYNLALGDARARAAREYLLRLGVDETRIQFQTRGEEEPIDRSNNEAAWVKNRRDDIVIIDDA